MKKPVIRGLSAPSLPGTLPGGVQAQCVSHATGAVTLLLLGCSLTGVKDLQIFVSRTSTRSNNPCGFVESPPFPSPFGKAEKTELRDA